MSSLSASTELQGLFVQLRPFRPEATLLAYDLITAPDVWSVYRFRDAPIPSFDTFSRIFHQNVFANFLAATVEGIVGIVTVHNADLRNGHAQLSFAFEPDAIDEDGAAMLEAVMLCAYYVTSGWNIRKIYVEVPVDFVHERAGSIHRCLIQSDLGLELEGRLESYGRPGAEGQSGDLEIWTMWTKVWSQQLRNVATRWSGA